MFTYPKGFMPISDWIILDHTRLVALLFKIRHLLHSAGVMDASRLGEVQDLNIDERMRGNAPMATLLQDRSQASSSGPLNRAKPALIKLLRLLI